MEEIYNLLSRTARTEGKPFGGGEPTGIGSYLAVVHSKPNMPHLPYGGKGTVPRLPHRSLSAENPQGKANREIARSPGKGRHNIS